MKYSKKFDTLLKIDAFIKSIKSLKKNKGFEMYIEVNDTYDEVNVAVSDILKFIHSLLYELTSESFYSVVTEELELSPNNDHSDDEANESRYIILPPNAMYDKPVGYFTISYFSAKKVNQLQDQIHKLCKLLKNCLYKLFFKILIILFSILFVQMGRRIF